MLNEQDRRKADEQTWHANERRSAKGTGKKGETRDGAGNEGGACQPAVSHAQVEEELTRDVALVLAGWDVFVGGATLLVSNVVFLVSALALISVQMVLSLA